MSPTYAHTLRGRPETEWEPLIRHLDEVAALTRAHSGVFGAAELGAISGLWHDLGKYAPQFQAYLRDSEAGRPAGTVDHSTAGAINALKSGLSDAAGVLAFVISGHHTGLPDLGTPESEDGSCLRRRLASPHRPESVDALKAAPSPVKDCVIPELPPWVDDPGGESPLRVSMFVRMLFSCLIDADRLATEKFCSPERARERRVAKPSIAQLSVALKTHIDTLMAKAAREVSPIAAVRGQLLAACRQAATQPQGLFSLTAPTGAGKTLSSMTFALQHALEHGLRRVIYALPFTSVTEQNADVFREAFGAMGIHAVLEHHSACRSASGEAEDCAEVWRRLAVENWDAPVIVTTNVQLLESLFAARTSECRKLHRIAESVVILDEAQSLPVALLKPTLAALKEIAASYRTSVVLCSATMPAVGHTEDFPIGLTLREIVPDPQQMAQSMRRATVSRVGPKSDDELAERIAEERQVLAIVNTRQHAARLFEGVGRKNPDALLHLSALMCPEHRSLRVAEIKARLARGEDCRVISTQVVEAGVDIDFPVVIRAFAGLDSIIQAAGRCNREGRGDTGRVEVFETDVQPPPGMRTALDATGQVLLPGVDALDLRTIEQYFRFYYWQRSQEWDGGLSSDGRSVGLTGLLSHRILAFRAAAEAYRLIDDWAEPLVVPHGEKGREVCHRLANADRPDRSDLRDSQRFTVAIPPQALSRLLSEGRAVPTVAGPAVLTCLSIYSESVGLQLDRALDPTELMV